MGLSTRNITLENRNSAGDGALAAAGLAALHRSPQPARLLPHADELTADADPVPVARLPSTVLKQATQLRDGERLPAWKHAFDIAVSAMLLVVLMPLLLMIALLVKIDSPGPVLFRQRRLGLNTTPFVIYKFRSMQWCAADDPSVPQARRNDPRVTRLGAILRCTSLDELPQLFNVLKGDMSLVGPRPHAVAHDMKYAQLIDHYMDRYLVRPGITGWAQVNGYRGETDTVSKMLQRVSHDLYYIENWSVLLDFKIFCRTTTVFFKRWNAY